MRRRVVGGLIAPFWLSWRPGHCLFIIVIGTSFAAIVTGKNLEVIFTRRRHVALRVLARRALSAAAEAGSMTQRSIRRTRGAFMLIKRKLNCVMCHL